jgi:hypothetical protein
MLTQCSYGGSLKFATVLGTALDDDAVKLRCSRRFVCYRQVTYADTIYTKRTKLKEPTLGVVAVTSVIRKSAGVRDANHGSCAD